MTPRRIVLTGGPGAGKTTIAQHLLALYPQHFALVPEAATQVFHTLHLRWAQLDTPGRRDLQRHIYAFQLRQETQAELDAAGRLLLLDRGTIDGAAYWPDGPDAFWPAMNTTHAAELARYDAVLCLQTCAALDAAYDGPASNAVRYENRPQALLTDRAVHRLWQPHPHFHPVPARNPFPAKLAAVLAILRQMLLLPD